MLIKDINNSVKICIYQIFFLTLHHNSRLPLGVMVSTLDFDSKCKGSNPLVATESCSRGIMNGF